MTTRRRRKQFGSRVRHMTAVAPASQMLSFAKDGCSTSSTATPCASVASDSKRLLAKLADGTQIERPAITVVVQLEELHHRIDLVEIFGHGEARDLGLERF